MKPTDRQLLLSRHMYTRGCSVIGGGGIFDAGIAVAHFQDATEIMLIAAASVLNAKLPKQSSFDELWNAVDTAAEKANKRQLPGKLALHALNKCRVSFKHFGECPDHKNAESHRAACGEVLSFGAREYFDREFETISLVDLVHEEREHRQLRDAEGALARGDLRSAMECCAEAYDAVADRCYRLHSFGHLVSFASIDPTIRNFVDSQVGHVRKHVQDVELMLLASVCGVSATDVLFLREVLPARHEDRWVFERWPLDAIRPEGVTRIIDLLAQYSIGLSDCERRRERFVPGFEPAL